MMTIPFSDVNLVAVLVSTVACMALGFIWYSKAVFGTAWMKLTGIKEEDMNPEDMKRAMGTGLLATLIYNYFFAVLLLVIGTATVKEAICAAVLVWLATVLPGELHGVAWEKRPLKLMGINASNALVTYGIAASILQLMS